MVIIQYKIDYLCSIQIISIVDKFIHMANVVVLHKIAISIVSDIINHIDYKDIFSLQLFFYNMNTETIRELIQFATETDNDPKKSINNYLHKTHFQLVADCMLLYYYYTFENKNILLNISDGEPVYENSKTFLEEKEYWLQISNDNEIAYSAQREYQDIIDIHEITLRNTIRPRLFSRDTIVNYK